MTSQDVSDLREVSETLQMCLEEIEAMCQCGKCPTCVIKQAEVIRAIRMIEQIAERNGYRLYQPSTKERP